MSTTSYARHPSSAPPAPKYLQHSQVTAHIRPNVQHAALTNRRHEMFLVLSCPFCRYGSITDVTNAGRGRSRKRNSNGLRNRNKCSSPGPNQLFSVGVTAGRRTGTDTRTCHHTDDQARGVVLRLASPCLPGTRSQTETASHHHSSELLLHSSRCNTKVEGRNLSERRRRHEPTARHLSGDNALMDPHTNSNQCLLTGFLHCMALDSTVEQQHHQQMQHPTSRQASKAQALAAAVTTRGSRSSMQSLRSCAGTQDTARNA